MWQHRCSLWNVSVACAACDAQLEAGIAASALLLLKAVVLNSAREGAHCWRWERQLLSPRSADARDLRHDLIMVTGTFRGQLAQVSLCTQRTVRSFGRSHAGLEFLFKSCLCQPWLQLKRIACACDDLQNHIGYCQRSSHPAKHVLQALLFTEVRWLICTAAFWAGAAPAARTFSLCPC